MTTIEKQDKRKAYGREYMRKKRLDPAFRKQCYQAHMAWAKKNKEHLKAYVKKNREENPRIRLRDKAYWLGRKYGLTYEEYQEKRNNQKELCPICKNAIGRGATDHNHTTKQVRDILCSSCNRWIGFIEKNRHLVDPMLTYLDKWNNSITPVS